MLVRFKRDNGVVFGQDFGYYRGVPHNIVFECEDLGTLWRLRGPGYGQKGDYGNGSLLVSKERYLDFPGVIVEEGQVPVADVAAVWVIRPSQSDPHARLCVLAGTRVEDCLQPDGSSRWAIRSGGNVLNRDGEWELEPMPSSRTDDFFDRCRWPSLAEAVAFARQTLAEFL